MVSKYSYKYFIANATPVMEVKTCYVIIDYLQFRIRYIVFFSFMRILESLPCRKIKFLSFDILICTHNSLNNPLLNYLENHLTNSQQLISISVNNNLQKVSKLFY